MNEALLKIKYRNNKEKQYKVICKVTTNNSNYLIMEDEQAIYPFKYKENNGIESLKINNKEKEMLKEIINNLSKEE